MIMFKQQISFVGDPGLARQAIVAKIENRELGKMRQNLHNNLAKLDKAKRIGRRNIVPILKNIITTVKRFRELNVPLPNNLQRQCSQLIIS